MGLRKTWRNIKRFYHNETRSAPSTQIPSLEGGRSPSSNQQTPKRTEKELLQSVNKRFNPAKTSSRKFPKWLKWGVGVGVLTGAVAGIGYGITQGLGTTAGAVATGTVIGVSAGTVVGGAVLGTAILGAISYKVYKILQKNYAKKSVFSHRDAKPNGLLVSRSVNNITLAKLNQLGYGNYHPSPRNEKFQSLLQHNLPILNQLTNLEKKPEFVRLTNVNRLQDGTPHPIAGLDVKTLKVTQKLTFLANHEFFQQLQKDSLKEDLKEHLGENPFRKLSSNGMHLIAETFKIIANGMRDNGNPVKEEICRSLADCADSLSKAFAYIKKRNSTIQQREQQAESSTSPDKNARGRSQNTEPSVESATQRTRTTKNTSEMESFLLNRLKQDLALSDELKSRIENKTFDQIGKSKDLSSSDKEKLKDKLFEIISSSISDLSYRKKLWMSVTEKLGIQRGLGASSVSPAGADRSQPGLASSSKPTPQRQP